MYEKLKKLVIDEIDEKIFKYCFAGKLEFKDFVNQVIFEILKDVYYKNDEIKSLSSWLLASCKESEYQSYKRRKQYVRYYKEILKSELSLKINVSDIEDLNSPNMKTINNRLEGYKINSFKFIQLENMQKYQLLDDIISKRVCSNKNYTNKQFRERQNEIQQYFLSLKKVNTSHENIFKNMIHFYEIENKYSIELIYKISSYICETNLSVEDINFELLSLLFSFNSQNFSCENRFLAHRYLYINEIVEPVINEQGISIELNRLINILYIKYLTIKNSNIISFVLEQDKIMLLKMMVENYPLFSIVEIKDWNNKKIRTARQLYEILYKNIENPKIRT
ncbi:hypothetical protein CLPU_4c01670 [Gottschalkia purinilytica]|uniref:Uncharacterized protein n=1 Tax=Gottschalkia purinilytica TaxID=1503 RepID=A0A0L0WCD0_GOTPU|nr:hypothetical protein [Gottschalkia purinilytica]KNF09121.1 hypothetical protein CLPU_4c01670 [Gottschalkia purinilytica]